MDVQTKANLEIDKKENQVTVSVNPKIYSADVIYSAAYVFLDKAYVLVDGDPEDEIIVQLKPKNPYDLEKLGREFNNELLSYSFYKTQAEKNTAVREAMIQRVLVTNDPSLAKQTEEPESKELKEENYKKDPLSIAIPWEEKHKKKNGKSKQHRSKKG